MATNGKHSKTSHPELPQHELRRVAVAGQCDPKTIIRYLRGGPQPSTMTARVESALTECGYLRLVRDRSGGPSNSPS